MKRCPECRRDYYDDSLLYCLDDGSALLDGPSSVVEPATAILSTSSPAENATTRHLSTVTDEPPISEGSNDSPIHQPIKRPRAGLAITGAAIVLAVIGAGFGIYKLVGWSKSGPPISLEKAKVIRLTTTGKASSAAISPDGRYVVHVQDDGGQRSLWMRQVATQSNVQIVPPAPGTAFGGLTFSPDGDYVYYNVISQEFPQRALFQVPTLGGTSKKLVDNLSPYPVTFAPGGKQFAFIRPAPGRDFSLMIVNADGTAEHDLTTVISPPEALRALAWSPDGKRIVYGGQNFDSNDTTVFEVQTANGSTRQITPQRWLRVNDLAWLPDGSGLLMLATPGQSFVNQIWHVSYPDGVGRRLTNDLNNYQSISLAADSNTLAVVKSEQQASIWVAPVSDLERARPVTSGSGKADIGVAWFPDGKLVYHSDASGIDDIWITSADGGDPKQLTANSRINQSPAVSPDGRFIVFLSDRTGVPHLWRMNADGSDQRQLTNGPSGEQSAQFSPDGHWLVYRTASGRSTLWKIPADGGEPLRLTDQLSALSPSVSPDGKLFAYFFRDENTPWRIAFAPLDGGPPIKTFDVANASVGNPVLRWMPDGKALAYIDTHNGVSNIVSQPIDGGPVKSVTDFKTDLLFSFAFSPDGKQLAFSRGSVTSDVVLYKDLK